MLMEILPCLINFLNLNVSIRKPSSLNNTRPKPMMINHFLCCSWILIATCKSFSNNIMGGVAVKQIIVAALPKMLLRLFRNYYLLF